MDDSFDTDSLENRFESLANDLFWKLTGLKFSQKLKI